MIKPLDDFQVYQLAMDIAEEIYPIIRGWDYFDQDTLGKQLIRAADSIACPVEQIMYYTYVLRSQKDYMFYIGYTENLERRFYKST